MIDLTTLIVMILSAATPILFAALGELIFERAGVLKGELQTAGNQAFGDSWWAEQKNALAAERRQQAQAYRVAAFKESFFECRAESGNSFSQ